MSNRLQKVTMVLVLALPLVLTGCGSTPHSSYSGGGGAVSRKDEYKPLDAQLVDRSNNIQVYSTPENARQAMHRSPDHVVDEGNGIQTQYFNADTSPNSERLRLQYQNGRLVGKDIIPPNANADRNVMSASAASLNAQNNDANYIDLREYDTRGKSAKVKASSGTPTDNANAAFNNDFNAKLNTATGTSVKKY